MRERESTGMDVLFFVAGALVGAGIALLYAPRTGKEVREKVSDFTNDAMEKMKDFGATAQEKMKTSFYKGREMAQEKASTFASAGEPETETMVH